MLVFPVCLYGLSYFALGQGYSWQYKLGNKNWDWKSKGTYRKALVIYSMLVKPQKGNEDFHR